MNRIKASGQKIRQWVVGRMAPPMFYVSTTFLICLACLVVLWVDIPGLQDKVASAADEGQIVAYTNFETLVLGVMLSCWLTILVESLVLWLTRPWDESYRKHHWFGFLFCICPPLRMCARLPEMGERIWLPGMGWRRVDKRLRRRLERRFSMPMIVIAAMILPILLTEWFFKSQVAQYGWLRILLHFGTGVIWFAFAAEFILMVSVSDKKLAYCKKHWVDLAIILLPIFAFIRSLQVLRATRLARLMRVPQVSRLVRIYRLRGTALKAVQALIVLDVFQRWFATDPEKRLDKLQRQLIDLEDEAKLLRRKIARIKRQADAQNELPTSVVAPDNDFLPTDV